VCVKGLSDDDWSWKYNTLTGCNKNNRLFVCDMSTVYTVDLSNNAVTYWLVNHPIGLSVNNACNFIVTRRHYNKILEYKPDGQPYDEITLPSDVTIPVYAFQLADSSFIVYHVGPHGVSIIDKEGKVAANYKKFSNSTTYPSHVAVLKNGVVLFAYGMKNRIVLLDASLRNARKLTLPIDGGLREPRCLYFDESRSRLYVGEYGGQRVIIFDNVII